MVENSETTTNDTPTYLGFHPPGAANHGMAPTLAPHRPVATTAFPKSQTADADARFATQCTASSAKPVYEAQVAHPDAQASQRFPAARLAMRAHSAQSPDRFSQGPRSSTRHGSVPARLI